MDKVEKVLRRLTARGRAQVKTFLEKLTSGDIRGLDVKKLRSHNDILRVRKGDLRIIYRTGGSRIFILAIERRKKDVYKRL